MFDPKWFLPSISWDADCYVRPLIGGDEAMADMRATFKAAIAEAGAMPAAPHSVKGYVYLAAWRFDAARDLSPSGEHNGEPDEFGESALGWLLRLMRARIAVRVRLWLPARFAAATSYTRHAENHLYIARVIEAYNKIYTVRESIPPLGVCVLDRRLPRFAASHHHKMSVVRVGRVNVGYCGGVDFAFTRRNMPPAPGGDPQSGSALRTLAPLDFAGVAYPRNQLASDLPEDIYGKNLQHWHDQHIRLEGSAVVTLEQIFRERWTDLSRRPPAVLDPVAKRGIASFGRVGTVWHAADVIVSTPQAITADASALSALPEPQQINEPVPASSKDYDDSNVYVQFWQTAPPQRNFTVWAGLERAVDAANECIWIFDQYFWSVPFAERLNAALYRHPDLHVIVVVPPHADAFCEASHVARCRAYDALARFDPLLEKAYPSGIHARIGFYALWHPEQNRGIYQHAKAHIYDAQLLLIGSANCNARSFGVDTEVVAAVQSRCATYAHMRRLWNAVFPNTAWPWADHPGTDESLPIEKNGWGRIFFEVFSAAVHMKQPKSHISLNNLIPDAVCSQTSLPNGVTPRTSTFLFRLLNGVINPG